MVDTSLDTSAEAHYFKPQTYAHGESHTDLPAAYALKEQEEQLLKDIEAFLDSSFPEDGNLVRERFAALRELGITVARFPSVRASGNDWGERQRYGGVVSSNREDFLESLGSCSPAARLLHLPARAVGAHSYFIAKIHAFSFVSKLVGSIEAFYKPLRQVVFSIVCTLLAEEVYFSCLEDPAFSREIKGHLIDDLVSLWDSGVELCTAQHQPALETLWTVRDASPPSFGTMDGSSELMRVSLGMGKDWSDFLVAKLGNPETQGALEEFLFSLSFEEIQEVRSRLVRFGISAVNHDEVRSFLGTRPVYTMVKSTDPRAIYDFYMERRDMAVYRMHNAVPGPKKTLEEMYLRFRLTRKENQ
ncbi:MAG: hypothetical protein LBP80_00995 [Treponema sp.]|jgi:hypothetical protein|nr:hypothetical protein [Treponema sp.]